MSEPKFDIYSGVPGNQVWIEAVERFSNAQDRMEQIAEQTPGRYFVFSFGSRTVLAQRDTFEKQQSHP